MNAEATPAFFHRDGAKFLPTGLTRSPWDRDAVSGVAVSGLIAFLFDEACDHSRMSIARLNIDILGRVPRQPLDTRVYMVRDGRQMQLICAEISHEDRVAVRATVLRVRVYPSPPAFPAARFPAPEDVPLAPFLSTHGIGSIIRTRTIRGALNEPGRGTLWIAFDAQVVAGFALTPLTRAALIGDFGNGVGSMVKLEDWAYANMDIAVQFLRLPHGEWLLIDAISESAGLGHAVARSDFADVDGIYAHGFQTLFMAPRRS